MDGVLFLWIKENSILKKKNYKEEEEASFLYTNKKTLFNAQHNFVYTLSLPCLSNQSFPKPIHVGSYENHNYFHAIIL